MRDEKKVTATSSEREVHGAVLVVGREIGTAARRNFVILDFCVREYGFQRGTINVAERIVCSMMELPSGTTRSKSDHFWIIQCPFRKREKQNRVASNPHYAGSTRCGRGFA